MEALERIKEIVEKMSIDTKKVYRKGNHRASVRTRKDAQELKKLIPEYRKNILDELKRHEALKLESGVEKKKRVPNFRKNIVD